MRSTVVGLMFVLALAVPAFGQPWAYNPTALRFDDYPATEWAEIASFTVEVWNETDTARLYAQTVPRDTAVQVPCSTCPSGFEREIPATALAFPTVGQSYRVRLLATGTNGLTSSPSNFVPEFIRFSNCYSASTRLNQPVTVVYTGPLSVVVNMYVPLTAEQLVITAPGRVSYVKIELWGDGQPAQYYVPADGRVNAVVLGPFRRAGTYELEIRAVDERGCEGALPYPFPRLTVTP